MAEFVTPPFVQVNEYRINLNNILYVKGGGGGTADVYFAAPQEGKPHWITLPRDAAEKFIVRLKALAT